MARIGWGSGRAELFFAHCTRMPGRTVFMTHHLILPRRPAEGDNTDIVLDRKTNKRGGGGFSSKIQS